jgi:hypothetical protein
MKDTLPHIISHILDARSYEVCPTPQIILLSKIVWPVSGCVPRSGIRRELHERSYPNEDVDF